MPTQDEIQRTFDLAHKQELIAGNTFSLAQKHYPSGSPEFNQAYHDYVSTMQNVRNIYYLVSHNVIQSIASGEDLNKMEIATKQLQDSLDKLQVVESDIVIALRILTLAAAVTAVVVAPTPAGMSAAVSAVSALAEAIAAASSKGNQG
jgi:hypothetical protein